jgi:hypothetical protein
MAFWSKLGKGLLKVGKIAAPIALGATGVGLPAAMAVSGGLNALDKKVSGGSWKDALKSGAMGAGMAAAGAGAGKLGGWAGKFAGKMGAKTGQQAGAGYARNAIEGVANRAMAPQQSAFQRIMGNIGQGARTAQDVMGAVGSMRGAMGGGMGGYRTPPFNPNAGGYPGAQGRIPGRMMGQAMGRMDQRAPNLAYALQRGRNEAIMNQPFRMGGQMATSDEGDPASMRYDQLPPIYPNQQMGRGINPRMMPQY